MANGKSFLTGLVSGIGQGVSRRDEESTLAKQMMQMFLKAKMEQEFQSPKDIAQTRQAQIETSLLEDIMENGKVGGAGGFRPKSIKAGPYTLEREPTVEEIQRGIQQKAQEQSVVAAEKEKQVNLGKVRRLRNMATIIEKKYAETQPSDRLAGITSIPMSSFQHTEQQQIDYAYRTFVKGMRAQLARAMGDVGNLSEPEQKAAMDLVPKLDDNIEVGRRKIQTIRDFVDTVEAGDTEKARSILQTVAPQNLDFSSEEEVRKANLPKGTRITINGKPAIWE